MTHQKMERWRQHMASQFGRMAPNLDFTRLALNELLVLEAFGRSSLPLSAGEHRELAAIVQKATRREAGR